MKLVLLDTDNSISSYISYMKSLSTLEFDTQFGHSLSENRMREMSPEDLKRFSTLFFMDTPSIQDVISVENSDFYLDFFELNVDYIKSDYLETGLNPINHLLYEIRYKSSIRFNKDYTHLTLWESGGYDNIKEDGLFRISKVESSDILGVLENELGDLRKLCIYVDHHNILTFEVTDMFNKVRVIHLWLTDSRFIDDNYNSPVDKWYEPTRKEFYKMIKTRKPLKITNVLLGKHGLKKNQL